MKRLVFIGNCPIVEGFSRDCIYDLQRGKSYLIPKSLTNLINEHHKKSTWEEIKEVYREELDTLMAYFDFLKSNDLIFFSEDYQSFPSISYQWSSPYTFTNAIVEISSEHVTKTYLQQLFEKLEAISCPFVELRLCGKISDDLLEHLFRVTNGSSIRGLYLVINESRDYPLAVLKPYLSKSDKLISVSIFEHKTPSFEKVEIRENKYINITFNCYSIANAPKFSVSERNISVKMFAEGQNYNTFFNQKLMINRYGMIVGDLDSADSFGQIMEVNNLEEIIASTYSRFWKVNKAKIQVCKHCEFRSMCLDSRVPVETENGTWKYLDECNYNPFLGKWMDDEGYLPVSEMMQNVGEAL